MGLTKDHDSNKYYTTFGPIRLKNNNSGLHELHRHIEDYISHNIIPNFLPRKQNLAKIGTILWFYKSSLINIGNTI